MVSEGKSEHGIQGYIFWKILWWWGRGWLLGKKMETEGVGKKLKRREKGKRKKNDLKTT